MSNADVNCHPDEDRELQLLDGKVVLVVDDDDDSLELIRFILEDYGIEVITATSALEALETIRQFQLVDILISDISMPEIDGYQLIRQVRSLSPEQGGEIPAIALTACVGAAERSLSLESGFQMHLDKPVEPAELVTAITKIFRHFVLNKIPFGRELFAQPEVVFE